MMTFAIQRLNEGVRATLMTHFLALPTRDRCLRFGTSLAPQVIAAYVDGIDFTRDAVFGLHDDRLVLVGLAHLACKDDLAEVGQLALTHEFFHVLQGQPGDTASDCCWSNPSEVRQAYLLPA